MTTIVRTVAEQRAIVRGWRSKDCVIGVVPTMGALHDGHLSLVRAAKDQCDRVIVTIFVNPTQFDNPGDLAGYPRTEDADAALLAPLEVDLVFAPVAAEIYPAGFSTGVHVAGLAERLEGHHRPGHFDGAATVVVKLFGITGAERAYFGEKDWQQLQVVQRVTADLNLGVEVVACPTIREPDGLARSSRNLRLSVEARVVAAALPRAMADVVAGLRLGRAAQPALAAGVTALLDAGFERVEYLDLCDADTLLPMDRVTAPARLLAAAWVGGVRLIDNVAV